MAGVRSMGRGSVAIVTVAAVVLGWAASASAQDNGKRQDGQGKYAELTARWWQWILEQPVTGNPAFDETGDDAAHGQSHGIGPANTYFFLANVFNVSGIVERTIIVPAGKTLFFPVLDTEFDNSNTPTPEGEFPGHYSEPQLRALAASTVATTTEFHVSLDGVSLLDRVFRAKSPTFRYVLPARDNIAQFFGLDFTGPIHPAVADGYWIAIPPLAPGEHVVNFGGTFGPPIDFTADATYHITVQ